MEERARERTVFRFEPPPFCPEFRPTEEEFRDALGFIRKIQPQVAQFGICKVIPPKNWKPPFAINPHSFRFVPRVQKLNELDAKARVRLAFLGRLDKFWALQGKPLRIPVLEGRALDLYRLHQLVAENGGFEYVCRSKKWHLIQRDLGLKGKNGPCLRNDYEKILYPFDVYFSGALFDLKELDADELSRDSNSMQSTNAAGRMGSRKASAGAKDTLRSRSSSVPVPILIATTSTTNSSNEIALAADGDNATSNDFSEPSNQAAAEAEDCQQSVSAESSTEDPVSRRTRNELKRLQVFGAGPKMVVPGQLNTSAPTVKVEDVLCYSCGRGDREHLLLLCDTEDCGMAYHTFCLIPALNDVPRGEWRCPRCVAKQCAKPAEYGFEQSVREYSLQNFGEMADRFKTNYFKKPLHLISLEEVEREFWRLVQSLDDDVQVEYGADLHSLVLGSGFSTEANSAAAASDPTADCDARLAAERKRYAKASWNLNNISVADKSVLRYVEGDVSGMKVPWCYAGMCFSCFCWHTEDHWTYSINYLHFGEPKTWYGVPADDAEKLEVVMREQATDLFRTHPDLMHQLTVTLSPTTLMNAGVRVCKAYQRAGEFIVTLPRSYHAGFNQGFNFAEAVNFTLAEWIPMGRQCVEHYRDVKRSCVFAHDELLVNIAAHCDEIYDFESLRFVQADLATLIGAERRAREKLDELIDSVDTSDSAKTKRYDTRRVAMSKLNDEERECDCCRTTCSLSMLVCSCVPVRDPEQCELAAHTDKHARRAVRMGRMQKTTMSGSIKPVTLHNSEDAPQSQSRMQDASASRMRMSAANAGEDAAADDNTVPFVKPRLVCLRCADQLRCPNCEGLDTTEANTADHEKEDGLDAVVADGGQTSAQKPTHSSLEKPSTWRLLYVSCSLEELDALRDRVARRFDELETGRRDLRDVLERLSAAEKSGSEKLDMDEIREFIEENSRRFAAFDEELAAVRSKLRAAEKFREAVRELMYRRTHQTRNTQAPQSNNTVTTPAPALLKYHELRTFVDELFELPFRIHEGDSLKNLLRQIADFRERVWEMLRTGSFKLGGSKQTASLKPLPTAAARSAGLAGAHRDAQEMAVRGAAFDLDMLEVTYVRTYTAQLGWLSELCRAFGMKPSRFASLDAVEHAFLDNIDRYAARVSKSKTPRTETKAGAESSAAPTKCEPSAEETQTADVTSETQQKEVTPIDSSVDADSSTKPKLKAEAGTDADTEADADTEEQQKAPVEPTEAAERTPEENVKVEEEDDADLSSFCCSLADLDRLVRDANALVIDPCAYAGRSHSSAGSGSGSGKSDEADTDASASGLPDFRSWPSTRVVKRCLQELDLLKFTASDHELQARSFLDAIAAEQQRAAAANEDKDGGKRPEYAIRSFPTFRVRVTDFEQLLTDNRYLPVLLPSVEQLDEIETRVTRVVERLAELYDATMPPYFDSLEALVSRLAATHVGYDVNSKHGATLRDIESQYALARTWKMRLARLFLGNAATCRTRELLRVLLPPNLIELLPDVTSRKRLKATQAQNDDDATADAEMDANTRVARGVWYAADEWLAQRDAFAKVLANPAEYDDAEGRHSEALARTYARMYERAVAQYRELRERNLSKSETSDQTGVVYCVCKRANGAGAMIQCELCRDWLHVRCVQSHLTCTLVQGILQRDAAACAGNGQQTSGLSGKPSSELSDSQIAELIGDLCYVCPNCARTRRPRLADVLGHLTSLQSITRIRLLEADVLQSLVDRCVTFMKRVEQFRAVFPLAAATMRELRNRKRLRTPVSKRNPLEPQSTVPASANITPPGSIQSDDSALKVDLNLRGLQRALEELLFEGNVLEIGMDELDELWLLHQFVQRYAGRQAAERSGSDVDSELEGDDDVKVERAGESALQSGVGPSTNRDSAGANEAKRRMIAGAGAERAKLKVRTHLVGRRQRKQARMGGEPTVKRCRADNADQNGECADESINRDDDDDQADSEADDDGNEQCSANECRRPVGADIQWIQCDGEACQKWYHFDCVGLTSEPSDDQAYLCPLCTAEPVETVLHSEIPANTTFL